MPTSAQFEKEFLAITYVDFLESTEKLVHRLAEKAAEMCQNKSGLTDKDYQQANAKVDAMIAQARKVTYQNRDKIPEQYLDYSDVYNEVTGQEPTKRVIQDWMMTFHEWIGEGLQSEHIRNAYEQSQSPKGGFLVNRPGSLTNTAVALKSKPKQAELPHPAPFQPAADPATPYIPMPDSVRLKMRALSESKRVKEIR